MNISDKMIFDGITIISSIIAIGYTVYAMKTKNLLEIMILINFINFQDDKKKYV